MPRINNQDLTLSPNGANVTIKVKYTATFSRFERNLGSLGLRFREVIAVVGIDPPGGTTGTDLFTLGIPPIFVFPLTAGNTDQVFNREITRTVARALLNEDVGVLTPDDDEIRCRIRITADSIPVQSVEALTDQEILVEIGGAGTINP